MLLMIVMCPFDVPLQSVTLSSTVAIGMQGMNLTCFYPQCENLPHQLVSYKR